VAPQLSQAAQPLATAAVPLTHALTSPDASSASARVMRSMLRRAVPPQRNSGGSDGGASTQGPPSADLKSKGGPALDESEPLGAGAVAEGAQGLGAYAASAEHHNTQRVVLRAPAGLRRDAEEEGSGG